IKKLSISQAQMVEIAKSLSHNAKIIFMDEPTSSLSPTEQEKLFQVIRELKERGVSITYVSHRLEEIMDICDRVTILRDGQLVTSMDIKDTNMDEIINRMVGRDLSNRYPKMQITPGETLLEVKHLSKNSVLHDISFSARAGEILGISGFVGAGRTELVRAVFGADPVDSGEIWIEGKKVQIRNVTDAVNHGIALLTEDRKNQGLLLNMSIKDNISVSGLNCVKTKQKF
ncbi:D-xylose ABC transporter ATP-binding protein, partial [Lactonifactor longoviformis]